MSGKSQRGFTLVELAIVLVIIGLILGMAFKGKDLIDGAKVKSLAAQYNKMIAAPQIFYEKYGFYPGDGCPATAVSPADCNLPRNGLVCGDGTTYAETNTFWTLLFNAGIVTAADRKSVFGQDWNAWSSNSRVSAANAGYGATCAATWLDLNGGPQSDPRHMCALDRMVDDGIWNTGRIQTIGVAAALQYTAATDCWNLTGQVDAKLQILP